MFPARFERAAYSLGGCRSIQLSYENVIDSLEYTHLTLGLQFVYTDGNQKE